jgi:hypothetical protein
MDGSFGFARGCLAILLPELGDLRLAGINYRPGAPLGRVSTGFAHLWDAEGPKQALLDLAHEWKGEAPDERPAA